jgi:cell volume regulation protein A
VRVPEGSEMSGVEVSELRLPRGAQVTLIVRDGQGFVPAPSTVIRHGDDLMVVATAGVRITTEQRLRAVSRRGRLAGWFGEHGD